MKDTPSKKTENGISSIVMGAFAIWAAVVLGVLAFFPIPPALWLVILVFFSGSSFALLSAGKPKRNSLARMLEKPGFALVYRYCVRQGFFWLWHRATGTHSQQKSIWAGFKAALSTKVYDAALLIAILYPLVLVVLPWLLRGEAILLTGEEIVQAVPQFSLAHLLAVSCLLSLAYSRVWRAKTIQGTQEVIYPELLMYTTYGLLIISMLIGLVRSDIVSIIIFLGTVFVALTSATTLTSAGAFGIALSATGACAVVVTVALTLSGAGALVIASTGAIEVTGAIAIAGTVEIIGRKAVKNGHESSFLVSVSLFLFFAVTLTTILIQWSEISSVARTLFLFLADFPLANAFFDAVSYALTLALIGQGLRQSTWVALWFGAIDVISAVAIFALLGLILTAVIAGLNALADAPLLPLEPILTDLADGNTAHENRWVIYMVFSTLVPTGLHLILSIISVQDFVSPKLRRRVAASLRATGEDNRITQLWGVLGFGLVCAIPVAIALSLLWSAYHLFEPILGAVGWLYLEWLTFIANLFGATPQVVLPTVFDV